jgi:hypothetical protein
VAGAAALSHLYLSPQRKGTTANKRLSVQSPGCFSNHWVDSSSSKSFSSGSLSKGVLTIGEDSDDGKSGYQSIDSTPCGDCAEPCGGHWYGTPAERSLGEGRLEKLLTPGRRAPHSTTNNDLADSDDGKSGYQSVNMTPHGKCAEPCGGHWYGTPTGGGLGGGRPKKLSTLGAELLALPPQKIWLTVRMARAVSSLLTGFCLATVQSLVEVIGTRFPMGAAKAGAGQGVCLLPGLELLTPSPTKTWQTVMMARAGTSLLTGLCVATVQSLVGVIGMGFLLGLAAAGAGQGSCILLGVELLTLPPTKMQCH